MPRGQRRYRILSLCSVRAARANGRTEFNDGHLHVVCRDWGWTVSPVHFGLHYVREAMLRDDLRPKYGP